MRVNTPEQGDFKRYCLPQKACLWYNKANLKQKMSENSSQETNPQAGDLQMLSQVLKKIPLFSTLDETLHQDIIKHIVLMYYPAKYTIFKEGDAGDALYILKTGQVKVLKAPREAGDLPEKLAEIGENGFFGEMALVSEMPRNATVQTITDSEVFILNKADFKKLLDTNSKLAEQVSATVVSRLNANNSAQ